jgi:hypothetical protein
MESTDVLIIIGKRSAESGYFPLTIETTIEGSHKAKLEIDFRLDVPDIEISGSHLGLLLYQSFVDSKLWYLIENLYNFVQTSYYKGALLIELDAPELFHLPWEDIFDTPELSFLSDHFTVIRYIDKPSSIVIKPFQYPLNILIYSDTSAENKKVLPTDDSLKYFHTTTIRGGRRGYLKQLLQNLKFQIIHIIAHTELPGSNTSALYFGNEKVEITPRELLQLLKRTGARFLILQCYDFNLGAILNLVHNLLHPDGPAILILKGENIEPQWTINEIYMNIVHDITLRYCFEGIPKILSPVLFIASGGSDVLRISLQSPRIYADLESKLQYLKRLKETIPVYKKIRHPLTGSLVKVRGELNNYIESIDYSGQDPQKPDPQYQRIKFIDNAIYSIENEIRPAYLLDYRHESGALIPLKDAEEINSKIDEYITKIKPYSSRVVNSWFRRGDEILPRNKCLSINTTYIYEIQIGLASKKSNVLKTIAIAEDELARFYSEDGIKLRVELFSNDFQIKETSQLLILPPPPNESNAIDFEVKTPKKDCIARLRVCVYYEMNLIQSLLVQAVIGNPEINNKIAGNQAEVDYSLSGSLTELESLPQKKLNIAINKSENGTHSLYIKGNELKQQLDFGESELKNTVLKAREKLQMICGNKDTGYKFDSNNRGNEKKFILDLIEMATLGYKLYAKIIINENWEFEDQLAKALSSSEIPIQIASTKSAKYVFPWALVYDKPLVQGSNEICPQFLSDLKIGNPSESLAEQQCIKHGCPNHGKNEIICPSGFWGYKHNIEQPITLDINSSGINEIPLKISTNDGSINFMMGISQELNDYNGHMQEINSLGRLNLSMLQTKQEIGIGLQRNDLHLIYFYCHGGRKGDETWLGIGKKDEKLVPDNLLAWKVRWPLGHPLIFINGCHTVDVTPDDFIDFNSVLARCKAAGVIGTEISVPEILARHFAVGFFQNFFNKQNVGKSIRDQRLLMLRNYNLLGLAYTPYCYSDLEIV